MSDQETAISLREIAKKYRLYDSRRNRLKDALPIFPGLHHREFWALDDISIDIPMGQTLGIVGVNGSGKSTLLQIICGLLQPTRGQVQINGRISALLELGSGFDPMLSGSENVYLQGAILGFSRQEMDLRYEQIVEFADIGDFIDQPVRSYSSGMMIRLAFSVAIQVEPEILIVDEALAVGDVFFQSKCFRKFEQLRAAGVTIVLVSHQLDTVQSLCDLAIFLDGGRLLCQGAPKEVVAAYQKHAGTLHKRTIPQHPRETKAQEEEEAGSAAIATEEPPAKDAEPEQDRHGNGKASLVAYSVNDHVNGHEVMVGSAKPLSVKVRFEANELIEKPVVGIRINTLNGFQVYGNNTTFAGFNLESCSPGDVISLEFRQTLYLNKGSYMLTLVMAEWKENGELEYVDRIVDATHLLITDGPYPYAGLCNFEGTVALVPFQKDRDAQ